MTLTSYRASELRLVLLTISLMDFAVGEKVEIESRSRRLLNRFIEVCIWMSFALSEPANHLPCLSVSGDSELRATLI